MQLQEDLPLAVLGDSRNFPPVEMVVPVQGEAVAMAVLAFENLKVTPRYSRRHTAELRPIRQYELLGTISLLTTKEHHDDHMNYRKIVVCKHE